MYARKKKSSKKVYFALILLVVLIVAVVAIFLYNNSGSAKPVVVGVNVGDTFTYSIKGSSALTGIDAVTPDYFYQYNNTDYYKVTIAAVNGSNVSLDTQWRFLNGTEINESQTINLSNGEKSNQFSFWALYAADLNVKDLLRPNGFDQQIVNKTDTQAYADSSRARNFFFVENEFFDVNDPTRNTLRYDYVGVYFDKQTGMLETLNNLQSYNNPQMNLVITWKLVDSSVWKVK